MSEPNLSCSFTFGMGCGASKAEVKPFIQDLDSGHSAPADEQAAEALALHILELLLEESRKTQVKLPVQKHSKRMKSGGRGFSLPFLRALGRFYEARDAIALEMGDICKSATLEENVCTLTASTGLSLIESCVLLAKRKGLDASALFAPATTFFSYSWTGSPLADVVAAVQRGVGRLGKGGSGRGGKPRFVWLDMLCASQNLLAGKYEDEARHPKGTPGYAARKEDTDDLFDGALDACGELIFYLAPLVDEWDAPPHPPLRADRAAPPLPRRRKGPRATTRAGCRCELATTLSKPGTKLIVELRPDDMTVLQRC